MESCDSMANQMVKVASQNFCVSKNKIRIILCRGVYLAQNTLQAASVRMECVHAADCKIMSEKAEGLFRQAKEPWNPVIPWLCCY